MCVVTLFSTLDMFIVIFISSGDFCSQFSVIYYLVLYDFVGASPCILFGIVDVEGAEI